MQIALYPIIYRPDELHHVDAGRDNERHVWNPRFKTAQRETSVSSWSARAQVSARSKSTSFMEANDRRKRASWLGGR
jgi:hypothetical protein